ncbi:hypothetical protein SLA2020_374990 [Shorea laevis]
MPLFYLPPPPPQTPFPVFTSSSSTTNTRENIPPPPLQTLKKSPRSYRRKHRLLRFNNPPQTPPSLMPCFYVPLPPPKTLETSPLSHRKRHRLLRFNDPPQTPPSLLEWFYLPPPPPQNPEKTPPSPMPCLPPFSSTANPVENTAFSDSMSRVFTSSSTKNTKENISRAPPPQTNGPVPVPPCSNKNLFNLKLTLSPPPEFLI